MIPAAEVRVLLAERRREAEQRLAGTAAERAAVVAASRDSNADVLAQRVRQTLTDVAVAERRLAEGEYQVCERCGGPIADDRLRALPTVRTCRECAGRST